MGDLREGLFDLVYLVGEGNGMGRVVRLVLEDFEEEGIICDEVEVELEVEDCKVGRGWKWLVKKVVVEELDEEDRGRGRVWNDVVEFEEEELEIRRIMKKLWVEERDFYWEKGGRGGKGISSRGMFGKKGEKEMKEMWDFVVGNGDDFDDDRFIDDEGVLEEDCVVYSDGEGDDDRDWRYFEVEEVEEDEDEDGKLFGKGKKKKKLECIFEEIVMFVE